MTPPAPRLVIFDLDGCLIDSEGIALAELVALMTDEGITITIPEARGLFLGSSITDTAAWAEAHGATLTGDAFADAWYQRLFVRYASDLRPMPGATALLGALADAGIGTCIATGGSIRRMTYALELTGLDRYFPGRAYSADVVAHGKPAPDLFLYAAAAQGTAPADCLVIEDAPAGVIAAVRAGMPVEGFVGGSHLEGLRDSHAAALTALGARRVHGDLTTLASEPAGITAR